MDKKSAPTSLYRDRRSFAKIPDVMDVPNLIAIQTESFRLVQERGLGPGVRRRLPRSRTTPSDMCVEFGTPRVRRAQVHGGRVQGDRTFTYQAPLFVEIRFINRETGEIKEQEVFMGDFPLMTPRGTFIINGTERVVVSQLVRSPGVYFASERDKTSDKTIYNAKVIPSRGAWLEFETDKRDLLSVRIDRKRKQPATLLVRALGLAETRERSSSFWAHSEMVLRTLEPRPRHHQGRVAHRAVQALPSRRAADRSTPPARCSTACSSTRSAMTWPRSAATRSTRSSASTPEENDVLHADQ